MELIRNEHVHDWKPATFWELFALIAKEAAGENTVIVNLENKRIPRTFA